MSSKQGESPTQTDRLFGLIPIARAEFTIAPLLQVPPASRGEPRTGSVPPASRENLKEGVFNRACFCKLCPRDWYYAQFAATAGRKVVVLSSDNEFILRCGGRPNLIPQLVRYRLEIDEAYKADWEAVSWLLYHLAVVYGRLDLRADDSTVRLYGVWQGKGAPDWDDERLKITVEPSNTPLEQALQRTMRILQAVGNP